MECGYMFAKRCEQSEFLRNMIKILMIKHVTTREQQSEFLKSKSRCTQESTWMCHIHFASPNRCRAFSRNETAFLQGDNETMIVQAAGVRSQLTCLEKFQKTRHLRPWCHQRCRPNDTHKLFPRRHLNLRGNLCAWHEGSLLKHAGFCRKLRRPQQIPATLPRHPFQLQSPPIPRALDKSAANLDRCFV